MTPPTDEARAGEPRPSTEAGRAMLNRWGAVTMPPGGYDPKLSEWREAILAIEREAGSLCNEGEGTVWHYCDYDSPHHLAAAAPALDVDRLAQAIHNVDPSTVPSSDDPTHSERQAAEQIAAEYARLSESADDR